MFRPSVILLVACTMLVMLNLPESVSAAGPRGPFGHFGAHREPAYVGTPQNISPGPPGPHRYAEYDAARAPWYGYGFGVPTYSWGYFGATHRPATITHRGYYGTYTQWGYRWGY